MGILKLDRKEPGSMRSQAIEQLDRHDPELAEQFRNLPPNQRAFGLLQGKMLSARGVAEMQAVFDWFDVEYKEQDWYKPFSYLEKIQIIAATLPLVAGTDEKAYRAAVKIWAACHD